MSLNVEIEIEKQFVSSFLGEDYRILTIKLLNAGNIPESWVGNNFTASLPIPKENNETIGNNYISTIGKAMDDCNIDGIEADYEWGDINKFTKIGIINKTPTRKEIITTAQKIFADWVLHK